MYIHVKPFSFECDQHNYRVQNPFMYDSMHNTVTDNPDKYSTVLMDIKMVELQKNARGSPVSYKSKKKAVIIITR